MPRQVLQIRRYDAWGRIMAPSWRLSELGPAYDLTLELHHQGPGQVRAIFGNLTAVDGMPVDNVRPSEAKAIQALAATLSDRIWRHERPGGGPPQTIRLGTVECDVLPP